MTCSCSLEIVYSRNIYIWKYFLKIVGSGNSEYCSNWTYGRRVKKGCVHLLQSLQIHAYFIGLLKIGKCTYSPKLWISWIFHQGHICNCTDTTFFKRWTIVSIRAENVQRFLFVFVVCLLCILCFALFSKTKILKMLHFLIWVLG